MQMWKLMTKTVRNMETYPKYYQSLVRRFDNSFREYTHIIDLDVKRTKAAIEDPTIYRSLTNILMAYCK